MPNITYPWELAPPWATCAAMDKDGQRYFFSLTPKIKQKYSIWQTKYPGKLVFIDIYKEDVVEDFWKTTLSYRPVI